MAIVFRQASFAAELPVVFLDAVGTDTMGEISFGMLGQVGLELIPEAFVVSDFLAVRTDGCPLIPFLIGPVCVGMDIL